MIRYAIAANLVLLASTAMAQESGQSLDQAASDPTASLMSFQLQDFYSYRFHNLPGESANRVQFRAAIPFTLAGTSNIARVTVPYITDSPGGVDGLSDITVFNLTTFDAPWGRWGVGAVALFPTGTSGLSAEKWAIGPAAGFSAQAGKVLWGAFNQNLLTVAGDDTRPDVNLSTFQPILNIGLGNGWSTGLSEMVFTYDWDAGEFTSRPLGVKLSKLTRFGTTPVQFTASYEHNFYDKGAAESDTVSFTVKPLLPKS
ncbi:hypothetical protein SuNHUV7_14350 (plasmid) [Pseudoseohaeicola sp. NH-UV-7]|uniref:hypothetical protein n=1 Tax=Sulfitobacter sp. TBRI5 TaxID=2989732 RepID=UPI003A5F3735